MSALAQLTWTTQRYLDYDQTSDTRHEYFQGDVYDMAGASRKHSLLNTNATTLLNVQLRQRPCEVYANDMRVCVDDTHYFYPDIVIVCGKPDIRNQQGDTLFNPTVVIEILSASTESYDRGRKFRAYRRLTSLQEYVLISQDELSIDHYVRQNDTWGFQDYTDAEAIITLNSVGCVLRVGDIYEKVALDTPE
jgi:Uma2 family endonuclease